MSSLRRVSSRQRLVSWDAFDATAYYDSSTEGDDGDDAATRGRDRESSFTSSNPNPSSRSHGISPFHRNSSNSNSDSSSSKSTTGLGFDNTKTNLNNSNNTIDTVNDDSDEDSLDCKRKRRLYGTSPATTAVVWNMHPPTTATAGTTMMKSSPSSTLPFTIRERDEALVHVIPASPCSPMSPVVQDAIAPEDAATTTSPLLQLPVEVQCMIYQYLHVMELRYLTQVCTALRRSLVQLPSSLCENHPKRLDDTEPRRSEMNDIVESALWRPLCIHQYWPFLQEQQVAPFIVSITNNNHHQNRTDRHRNVITNNYPLLLSMAVSNIPTHIDTALFPYSRQLRRHRSEALQLLVEQFEQQHLTNSPLVVLEQIYLQPKMIAMNCTITTTTTVSSSSSVTGVKETRTIEYQHCQQQTHQVIQFIGKVGFGDQCIRSNAPFPRPKRIPTRTSTKWNLPGRPFDPSTTSTLFQRVFRNTIPSNVMMMRESTTRSTSTASGAPSLFCPLRRSVRIAARRGSTGQNTDTRTRIPYRPFCVPFVTAKNEINIAPRYIAYYEVTILPLPPSSKCGGHPVVTIQHTRCTKDDETTITKSIQFPPPELESDSTMNHRPGTSNPSLLHHNSVTSTTTTTVSDCVAVGIGTEHFPLQHRMPGWDQNSYGYHGDDGGIFHGNGSMIQRYNRTFGTNDTIGCGIDYIQNSIFFTLNGVFLGYAFPLLPKHRDVDLYPIIGMDTQYPIYCNFGGDAPFVFDLESMIQQQESILQEQLTL